MMHTLNTPFLKYIYSTIGTLLILFGSGCSTVPYDYGGSGEYISNKKVVEPKPQVEIGRPVKFVDTLGWIWGIPSKIILWDRRVDNHDISDGTKEALMRYLERNDLNHTKVRLNQYSPGAEFSRTVHNYSVGAGWRYTIGMLSWLIYTVFPQRVFGGDNYNPYSDTINIYSDVPAIVEHEGGHAKDFAKREYKGTYAVAYAFIPFFPLYSEAVASNDAISYQSAYATEEGRKLGYEILYPAYGTYVGGSVAPFLSSPWNRLAPAIFAIPGHIVGRIKAAEVNEDGYALPPTAEPDRQDSDDAAALQAE